MAQRDKVIDELERRLGGSMVDVELDREDYDLCIDKALSKFRQRSSRAVEEAYLVLDLEQGKSEYILPTEVMEVRVIYRRVAGGLATAGQDIEPFEAGFLNTYLLNSARAGGLLTFELYSQYRELVGRMFGAHVIFNWYPQRHTLLIHRNIRADDSVILHVYMHRPEEYLLDDPYGAPWIKDYALAHCKMILGQARSKFAQVAGPGGGTTLNGDALKTEAQAEIEKLETELTQYIEGGTPYTFIIG